MWAGVTSITGPNHTASSSEISTCSSVDVRLLNMGLRVLRLDPLNGDADTLIF